MRWGLLVRISDDRTGEALGVARQETDGRALVRARSGTVVKVYRENDVGAFKRKKVITLPDGRREKRVDRPTYREALADLYHGRIEALAVYDLDRFVRDPRDLEDAIDVVEDTGRPIAAVTGSIDLSTDHGITAARLLVAVANKASRDTARRVARKHLELAEAGRTGVGGRRPYGYTADRQQIVPAEAAIVRELAERRLHGEGWRTLAQDLNARGVPCVEAPLWTLSAVRAVILKPHVAGLRSHRGQIVTEGLWPAILDRDTWDRLQASVGAAGPPPARRYLLSGIARCAECGNKMSAASNSGRPIYRCKHIACGRVSRHRPPLDAYVTGVVLELLADVRPPRPAPDAGAGARLAGLEARRRSTMAAFSDVAAADPADLRAALAGIDRQIAAARAELAGDGPGRVLDGARGMTPAGWASLPLDRQRALVAALVRVTVGPSLRGRNTFDPATVQVDPVG